MLTHSCGRVRKSSIMYENAQEPQCRLTLWGVVHVQCSCTRLRAPWGEACELGVEVFAAPELNRSLHLFIYTSANKTEVQMTGSCVHVHNEQFIYLLLLGQAVILYK